MPIETAIWFPFWYQLDQPIEVEQVGDFDFFKAPPDYIVHDGRDVFYHGDWQEKFGHLFNRRRVKILSIRHPDLGFIRSIDTHGFDYTFTMSDGRSQKAGG